MNKAFIKLLMLSSITSFSGPGFAQSVSAPDHEQIVQSIKGTRGYYCLAYEGILKSDLDPNLRFSPAARDLAYRGAMSNIESARGIDSKLYGFLNGSVQIGMISPGLVRQINSGEWLQKCADVVNGKSSSQ